MANVLILNTVQNDKATCDFVVLGLTDQKYFSLKDENEFKEYIISSLKRRYDKIFNSYSIIYHGNITKFTSYNVLVEKLPKKGVQGKSEYRDYTRTKEAQLASKSGVIIAEDSQTSWNTVRSALGARNTVVDCYGIILEVIKLKNS